MKKIAVIIMILSVLFALCACNETKVDNTEPSDTTPAATQPQENVTIGWETPIDIDDSFLNETSSSEGATEDVTEGPTEDPTEGTEPLETNPTTGSESDPTEPTVTEPVISSPTNGSGAIELPMIPG